MADLLGRPPAASPRTPGGTQATSPSDPRQQLLHVLSRVLVQLETDPSFGQRHLDEDARISTIAQVRSFVHGHDDAPVEPSVLCRLAQILRDDEQSDFAAVLYVQQLATLSHNYDYGHMAGVHGAVSEYDMLDMISSHVELCGLVKGRAMPRHADEALRLATVLAGQKDGDLSYTRSRLHESAERLRQLRMAAQAARMGQQVARVDTAIKAQAKDIASQPWSKSNSRIPHAKKPTAKRKSLGGFSSDLAGAGVKDTFTVQPGLVDAADRRALLKATADMKEVLGLTQRVAELEQLLANSEARAQAASAMAEADVTKSKGTDRQDVEAAYDVTLERAFRYAYRRGCARNVRSVFYAWAVEVQRLFRDQAAASMDRTLVNRAAAAEQRLVEARQQIFLMEQEQAKLRDQFERAAKPTYSVDQLLAGWLKVRKRLALQKMLKAWRHLIRNGHVAEHAVARWRVRQLRSAWVAWRAATTAEAMAHVQQDSLKVARNYQNHLRAEREQISKNPALTGELPDIDSD